MQKMAHSYRNVGPSKRSISVFTLIVVYLKFGSAKCSSVEVFTEPSGVFQSPGYPDLDDGNECTWRITLPMHRKIRITFLEFDLLQVFFCNDEVEINDGDAKIGTYRGSELDGDTITSSTNIMTVVLKSCSSSFWWDRHGISVSYSTVYPSTTPAYETTKTTITTRGSTTTAASIKSTPSQSILSLSTELSLLSTSLTSLDPFIGLPSSASDSEQAPADLKRKLVPALLAVVLVSVMILLIIAIVTVKRRKAKHFSGATTTSTGSSETNGEQTVVSERNIVDSCHLEYDYVQGANQIQAFRKENVGLDQNNTTVSTNVRSAGVQKKFPKFDQGNHLCVYKNKTSNVYSNTDFDEDYGATSCSISKELHKADNDTQTKAQDFDISLDEGFVINTAYEPHIPES